MKHKLKIIGLILFVGLIWELVAAPAISEWLCRQWKGKHQHFQYAEMDNKIYVICGSCGDVLPVYEKFGGEQKEIGN